MKEFLHKIAADTVTAIKESIPLCAESVERLANAVVISLEKGGKILIFGNGGSAADAQHMAAEFVNRFRMNRRPLPAIALTTDSSVLTSVANDFDFSLIFSKQVDALAAEGDVVIGISTSGNSPNVLKGLEAARGKNAITAGFTGKQTAEMEPLCDIIISAASDDTPRIQEVHIFIIHIICELVERKLFA